MEEMGVFGDRVRSRLYAKLSCKKRTLADTGRNQPSVGATGSVVCPNRKKPACSVSFYFRAVKKWSGEPILYLRPTTITTSKRASQLYQVQTQRGSIHIHCARYCCNPTSLGEAFPTLGKRLPWSLTPMAASPLTKPPKAWAFRKDSSWDHGFECYFA